MNIKLPRWAVADTFPAFHDTESLSAIEMTARLYGAMNKLIEDYNKFIETIENSINEFTGNHENDFEVYKTALRQEFQDFIDVIRLRDLEQDNKLTKAYNLMVDNLAEYVIQTINNMRDGGELSEAILIAFEDMNGRLTNELENMTRLIEVESQARAQALKDEATARAKAIDAEATARQNADAKEKTARENADIKQTQEIEKINGVLARLTKRRFIVIGDSYTRGRNNDEESGFCTPWTATFKNLMGLTEGTDLFISGVSGSGFCGGETFTKQLNDLAVTDPDSITDIIVVGGANDVTYSTAQLKTAVQAFCELAETKYKNAMVHCGMIGWHVFDTTTYPGFEIVLRSLSNYARKNYRYMTNVEYALHAVAYMSSDGFHPNASGQAVLAGYIMQGLNGCANVIYSGNAKLVLENGGGEIVCPTFLHNNYANIKIPNSGDITFSTPIELNNQWNFTRLGSIEGGVAFHAQNENACKHIMVTALVNDAWVQFPAVLYFSNNKIYVARGELAGAGGGYAGKITTNRFQFHGTAIPHSAMGVD